MRMTQIEHALTIASEGSISRAAKKLYLSQPNLSLSLKQLEQELGSPLFERSGKGVVLTPFGREFLAFAQSTYRQFCLLGDFCSNMGTPPPKTFSVASQYMRFANTVFTTICQRYANEPYQFSFLEGSFQEIVDLVRNQEAEIGLLIISPMQKRVMQAMFQRSNLEYHKLSEEDIAIIVRQHHPLCVGGRQTVSAAELSRYPFALYRDIQYSPSPEWKAFGFSDIQQRITVKDRATLYELLSNTDAFTMGIHNETAYSNTQYYADKCVLRLSGRHLMNELGYITNKSRPMSPIAEEYCRELLRITKASSR